MRSDRVLVRLLCAAALLGCATGLVRSEEASDPASAVRSSRETLARWVETQQIIARERKDWRQAREILNARIQILQGEIAALEAKLAEQRAIGAESVRKKAEVGGDAAALKEAAGAVAGWTAGLERDLRALEPRLPEPVRTRVQPLFGRMPENPDTTQIAAAERLQNVVGILNEVNKFNGEITMVSEVRTLSDGKPSEVRTIYVGLAQAYYVSAGGEAGVGQPSEKGWEWRVREDLAPAVREAVEILQAKAKPRFVSLPVTVR